jgi:RHS repeat-associated protein
VYVENLSSQAVWFDDLEIAAGGQPVAIVVQETHYDPWGLELAGIGYVADPAKEHKFTYNGKEKQDQFGLGWLDYGARHYQADIGRWGGVDAHANLYFATSPYVYVLNQPTNAIDPDGKLVIFVNGNHFSGAGEGYWKTMETYTTYRSYNIFGRHLWSGYERHAIARDFAGAVMDQLGDHNARYYDGANAGWHPLREDASSTALGRYYHGMRKGLEDAKEIIAKLAKDKDGNIVESIKIITHSMGGAFGKGFVVGLKQYIRTLPEGLQKQILISLVADFDPHQAGDLKADPDIKTMQFIHAENGNITGMGWLANEVQKGIDPQNVHTNTGTSTDHSIFTFFKDISKLSEGTYKWDANQKKFIKQ